MSDTADNFPRGTAKPLPNEPVQVVMTERMARRFEERCLGVENTRGDTCLEGPLLFSEDDLPTYTIGLRSGSGVVS